MNPNDFLNDLIKIKDTNTVVAIQISYSDYKDNLGSIILILGNTGVVMFSQNVAAISFDGNLDIRFVVKNEKNKYSVNDFKLNGTKMQIIGRSNKDIPRFTKMLVDDLVNNRFKVIFVTIIYILLFILFGNNPESLIKLNDSVLNIISIFIASFFVFIGFFYSDKGKTIESFKKGIFDKHHTIDKYILKLSLLSILLSIVSTSILNFICKNNLVKMTIIKYISHDTYYKWRYFTAFICTYFCIIFLIICLDSITNYYLDRVRNNYFIDAFDELIKERK